MKEIGTRGAAELLGVSTARVLALRVMGRLKARWNGQQYLFFLEDGTIKVLPGKKRGRKPKRLEGEAALERARERGVEEGRLVEALDGLMALRGEGIGPSTE